jgi:hypothetical protein
MSTESVFEDNREVTELVRAPLSAVADRRLVVADVRIDRPFHISDGTNVVHWRASDMPDSVRPRCLVSVTNSVSDMPSAEDLARSFMESIGSQLSEEDCELLRAIEQDYRDRLLPSDAIVPAESRQEFDGHVLVPMGVFHEGDGVVVSTVVARFSSKRAVQSWLQTKQLIEQLAESPPDIDLPPMPTSVGLEMAVLTRNGEILLGARNDAGKAHDGYIQTFPGGTIMERYTRDDANGTDADTLRSAARAILGDELGLPQYLLSNRAIDLSMTPVSVVSSFGSWRNAGSDASGVYSAVQAMVQTDLTARELIAHHSVADERHEASGVIVVRLTDRLVDLLVNDEPVTMRELLQAGDASGGEYWHLPTVEETEFLDTPRRIRPNSLTHLMAVASLRG